MAEATEARPPRSRPARLERGASIASTAFNRLASAFVSKVTNNDGNQFSKSFDSSGTDKNVPAAVTPTVVTAEGGDDAPNTNEQQTTDFLIPNPVRGRIYANSLPENVHSAQLYGISGQLILSQNLTNQPYLEVETYKGLGTLILLNKDQKRIYSQRLLFLQD